jgi:NADH dehydrogenase
MNVLLTGGSGFVGRAVLTRLHEAGHRVRILSRNPGTLTASKGTEFHHGNILDPSSLNDAMTGTDAVIHLVGIISEIGESTFENIHTRGTKNVVDAASKAGVRRFIHMSALGTRPNALARYHQSKRAAEEFLRASGLDFTIFRPSIIHGPGDGFVNLFVRMSRLSPILPVIGPGKTRMQPVPIADVAECFVSALQEPKSIGQTYDLCGGEILTLEQIMDTILQVSGRRRMKLHVPTPLARMQAALLEFVYPRILRKPPPLNRDQLLMLQTDNTGNPAPANELFGLKPTGFREALSAWLAAQK